MKGYVIASDREGIYLGHCLGMHFWTKVDPVGQTHATVFPSMEEAQTFAQYFPTIKVIQIVEVEVESIQKGASIEDCVRAGLPAWNPNETPEWLEQA